MGGSPGQRADHKGVSNQARHDRGRGGSPDRAVDAGAAPPIGVAGGRATDRSAARTSPDAQVGSNAEKHAQDIEGRSTDARESKETPEAVMRIIVVLLILLAATPLAAQESQFGSDLRREGEDIQSNCGSGFGAKQIIGCAVAVATDDPIHVALGSLAPLNGTAFGAAFSEHYTPNERWRLSWNADAVAATSGSWRAGVYMKLVHIPERTILIVPAGSPSRASVPITEYPVFNIYAQTTSLDTLVVTAGQDVYSERQTIVGANVIYPLSSPALRRLRPSLVGAVNGRFLDIESPTPGLPTVPSFGQFEEGVRLKPSAFGDRLRFNYLVDFQQFLAAADAQSSFHRWTLDLRHDIPLYHTVSSTGPKDTNGPDDCFISVGAKNCPPVSYSRNLGGTISIRLLASRSTANEGSQVPFYFQPTIGGSDVNGQRLLSGYDDYQSRGPNVIAFQETFEHSIWGPIGAYLLVEQGKVTQGADGFGAGDWMNSVAVGLSLRAGGFPLINLSFAWGGDSHHGIATIDPTLLGGSARPSLY